MTNTRFFKPSFGRTMREFAQVTALQKTRCSLDICERQLVSINQRLDNLNFKKMRNETEQQEYAKLLRWQNAYVEAIERAKHMIRSVSPSPKIKE